MGQDPSRTIRAARPDELEDVLRLVLESYREFASALEPRNWEQLQSNVTWAMRSAKGAELLVAEMDSVLAGTVSYYPPGTTGLDIYPDGAAVLRLLAVLPEFRGRGLGRALSEEVVMRARRSGAPVLALHTGEMMPVATAMYERMGFRLQRHYPHLGVRFSIYMLPLDS